MCDDELFEAVVDGLACLGGVEAAEDDGQLLYVIWWLLDPPDVLKLHNHAIDVVAVVEAKGVK